MAVTCLIGVYFFSASCEPLRDTARVWGAPFDISKKEKKKFAAAKKKKINPDPEICETEKKKKKKKTSLI